MDAATACLLPGRRAGNLRLVYLGNADGPCRAPFEMAQGYVYLACDDSAFMTGQVLHIDGRLLWLFLKRTHLCAQRREIRGRRGLYRHLFTGNGMIKPGECTVQRLPSNSASPVPYIVSPQEACREMQNEHVFDACARFPSAGA